MIRIKDVAQRAGVSTATISRVMSGNAYVNPELRERVLAVVREMNYSPNGIARSMSRRKTHTLGLVVSDVTNPFFTSVARGVEDAGQASGYSVVLCNTDENPDKERTYLSVLRENRVDGILLAVSSSDVEHVDRLLHAGTKLVLIDRVAPGISVPSVLVDNVGAMREAVEYLLDLGHRRIGIVTGNTAVTTALERVQGYESALDRAGIAHDPALIFSSDFTEPGGHDAGFRLSTMPDPPTAVICSNNQMTTGLLIALRERGVHIPEDISIIGFDDLPYFSLLDHPLTAVAQPMYEMGRRACELLLQMLSDEDETIPPETQIRLPTHLVVRDSCREPRQQGSLHAC